MPYPHQILLADLKKKGKIKTEDFPTELQAVIQDFEKREKLAQNKETDSQENLESALEANSWLIAQRIHDYHVEPEEQEVQLNAESTPSDIHKAADEIIEEIEETPEDKKPEDEQTIPQDKPEDKSEDTQMALADNNPSTPPQETKEEPIAVDPVAAAIAAGAAKPDQEPSAEASAPIAPKAEDQVIPGYTPTGQEELVHKLFTSGKKEDVTIAELKEAGVNTSKISGLDATKFGRYTIKPTGMFTRKYNISFK